VPRHDKIGVLDGLQYVVIVPREIVVVLRDVKPPLGREPNWDAVH
jgi:hypothetical protein